jgi:hypothetical protein
LLATAFATLAVFAGLTRRAFSALLAAFARRTRLARRTLTARFAVTAFTRLTLGALLAAFELAAFRTEAIAPAAATTEVAVALEIAFALLALAALLARELALGLLAIFGGARLDDFTLGRALFIAFLIAVAKAIDLRLHRHGRLHRAQQTEIMVGVLEIILAQHAVAGAGGVARILQIAFVDQRRWAAHFRALRTAALHRAVGILVMMIVMSAARLTTSATAPLTLH